MDNDGAPVARGGKALHATYRSGDVVMLGVLFGSFIFALCIGWYVDAVGLAAKVGLPVLIVGAIAFAVARGRQASRCMLAFCNVGLVALHIQLAHGEVLFHFGVFAILAMLMAYRDHWIIIFTAGLFAVHHLLFNYLQLHSYYGIELMPMTGWGMVLLHCFYVIIQSGMEIVIAWQQRRSTLEAVELAGIVRHVDDRQRLNLDLDHISASQPMAGLLKQMLERIGAAVTEVQQASNRLETGTHELTTGNADLNQRTHQQTTDLQQAAEAVDRVTAAVHESAEAANRSEQLSRQAATTATHGHAGIEQMNMVMEEVAGSSQKIQDLTSEIDNIAFQTNILALNASVEAARAGEHGRGFKIVASEVRNLAQRSAHAASEIKALVETNVQHSQAGLHQAREAGEHIKTVSAQSGQVRNQLEQMATASSQQAGWLDDISATMQRANEVTHHNSALVAQTAGAVTQLEELVAGLRQVVAHFQLAGTMEPLPATRRQLPAA